MPSKNEDAASDDEKNDEDIGLEISRIQKLRRALNLVQKESKTKSLSKQKTEKEISEKIKKLEETELEIRSLERDCEQERELHRQEHFDAAQSAFKAMDKRHALERIISDLEACRQQVDSENIQLRALQRLFINQMQVKRAQMQDGKPVDITIKDLRSRLDFLLRLHYRKLHQLQKKQKQQSMKKVDDDKTKEEQENSFSSSRSPLRTLTNNNCYNTESVLNT
uniref:Uncharacterized protein n=1 Tax=Aureoumbra lagunensis TaxID=44058 RepID=A0A7S3NP85_9STRA|mmetsp:Transcript_7915/g.12034  ORF Transcript_7915/g.12034 Transcript_7915/m.12034 type:complete len:223 (+) Transcript_7915:47-715(+)